MSTFRDNAALRRFELATDTGLAFADYRRAGDLLFIDHVETPVALRGGGVAGKLMDAITGQARRDGSKIVPICSYAVAWLQRHPEHADLTR